MRSLPAKRIIESISGSVVAASLLSLAACGGSIDEIVPKDDDQVALSTETTEVTPSTAIPEAKSWEWAEGDLDGWTFGALEPAVQYLVEASGIRVTAPSTPTEPDVYIVSPLLKIDGSTYNRVLVDLEALKAGTKNDLRLFYSTAQHGLTADYVVHPTNGAALADGERRRLVYDVSNVSGDWATSTVQRIRFDFPQGAAAEYYVHEIRICNAADQDCL